MNDNQTYNSVVFNLGFKDETKSERSSSARGIATPDKLTVRSEDYVDAKNKIPGRRHNIRIGGFELDSLGNLVENVTAITIQVPQTATTGQMTTQLATFRALVAASGILEAVINNEK